MSDVASPIRILAVDDHQLLRDGIAAVIAGEHDMLLVADAADGRAAVDQFRTHRPDITLMDLQMPTMNGVEAIIAIRRECPSARIIVLTTYFGDAQAIAAMRAGARGFLFKSMLRKELLDTIRDVHAGLRRIPTEIATAIAEHLTDEDLSEREIEVLRHVAAGEANKQIAAQLSISEETVKAHLRNVMAKLNANDRTHAVTIAMKRGIFDR
jgi:DNA-binding NarL/FixJ family response regulator